ncbi:Aste57867_12540 [Aphanomyces stellatus]|uniref:Aste57867_12540 protein n=1 Tax=Aphanomyces stellatus TaxID=120398 RepID=A0A485KWL9_9STRA|nr:hypothetical protein As57867_012494 [Aphanomyces stellatus]VFT89391.1 Aste57867_12540 [Aphanomyces stellatus]
METVGQAKQRHKLELREWQNESKVLAKKWKKENMAKKEVESKLLKMEAEILMRHASEIQTMSNDTSFTTSTSEVTNQVGENGDENARMIRSTKLEKAQKKRDKKKLEEKERREKIEHERLDVVSDRQIECEQISRLLKNLKMMIKEIPSDGHCMYHAVADQLKCVDRLHSSVESHIYLRKKTADYLRSHDEDFLPFVEINYEYDLPPSEQYKHYCNRVEESSDWGGQIELRALAQALQREIIVYSSSNVITMGEEFQCNGRSPLRLSYHLHYYSLGAHYNSVVPECETADDF